MATRSKASNTTAKRNAHGTAGANARKRQLVVLYSEREYAAVKNEAWKMHMPMNEYVRGRTVPALLAQGDSASEGAKGGSPEPDCDTNAQQTQPATVREWVNSEHVEAHIANASQTESVT